MMRKVLLVLFAAVAGAAPAPGQRLPDVVRTPLGERADAALKEAEASGYVGVALVAKFDDSVTMGIALPRAGDAGREPNARS